MKYLCLLYTEENRHTALPTPEQMAISEDAMAYCDRVAYAWLRRLTHP
jgi:hypothetical protein